MEAGVDDADYQNETHFVHSLSKDSNSGINGIIASIRPENDEGFETWLNKNELNEQRDIYNMMHLLVNRCY